MYSAQATNGLGVTDGSGTINPAALNSSGTISLISSWHAVARDAMPRALGAMRCNRPLHYRDTDILGPVGALAGSAAAISPDTSPRGVKRSRSPDTYGELATSESFGEDGMLIPHSRRPSLAAATCWLRARGAAGEHSTDDEILRQANHESDGP